MPWRTKKQSCTNSKGKKGSYVIQKKKGGKWTKSGCSTSKAKAQASVKARYANEGRLLAVDSIIISAMASTLTENLDSYLDNYTPDDLIATFKEDLRDMELTLKNTHAINPKNEEEKQRLDSGIALLKQGIEECKKAIKNWGKI